MIVQYRQTHTVGYAVGTQYAGGMQYAVGVSAKRSIHTVDLANMVVGTVTFSAKRSLYPPCSGRSGCTVGADVGAKRSIHTVGLANMGGGDLYL